MKQNKRRAPVSRTIERVPSALRSTYRSLGLFVFLVPLAWAEPPDVYQCRSLKSETERLRCYDRLPLGAETTPRPTGDIAPSDGRPALEQRLEKERDLARRAFAVIPYRPNYILHTYSHQPNVTPFLAEDPNTDFQHQEIKFQFSLRVPLYNKMFGENGDLWFGYTQLSFWQAYNWERSSPFRETSHEPELGLSFNTDFPLIGLKHRLLMLGLSHQSNGRGEPLSRSWNRLWASFQLERGNFLLTLKPWVRIPESSRHDGNPDILDYVGRAELRSSYKYREQVVSFMLRNNLLGADNRSGYELGWSFPFSKRIKGFMQLYNGYGESLIDYDVRNRRVGLGILVEDWL